MGLDEEEIVKERAFNIDETITALLDSVYSSQSSVDEKALKLVLDRGKEILTNNVGNIHITDPRGWLTVFAYLSTKDLMELLIFLEHSYSGVVKNFLEEAKKWKEDTLVLNQVVRRLAIYERLKVIKRVFAPERLQMIQSRLEGVAG